MDHYIRPSDLAYILNSDNVSNDKKKATIINQIEFHNRYLEILKDKLSEFEQLDKVV